MTRAVRIPVSAGPDPFQREHEIANALLTLLIALSRFGVARAFRKALARKGPRAGQLLGGKPS